MPLLGVDLLGEHQQQPGDGGGHAQADEEARAARRAARPGGCRAPPAEADHVGELGVARVERPDGGVRVDVDREGDAEHDQADLGRLADAEPQDQQRLQGDDRHEAQHLHVGVDQVVAGAGQPGDERRGTAPIGMPMAEAPQHPLQRGPQRAGRACRRATGPSPAVSTVDGPGEHLGAEPARPGPPAPRRRRRRPRRRAARRRGGCGTGRRTGRRERSSRVPGVGDRTSAGRRRDDRRGDDRRRRCCDDGHWPCSCCTRSLNRVSNSWRDVDLASGSRRRPGTGRRAAAAASTIVAGSGEERGSPVLRRRARAARSGRQPYCVDEDRVGDASGWSSAGS